MFDFAIDLPEDTLSLTPMERQEVSCSIMMLQIALYAELVKQRADAPLSPEERETIFLVAARISTVGEA